MERNPYEEFLDPSVEELNRTRKDRVAARKKQKKAQKRANRRKAMASGKKRRRKPNKVVLVLVIVIAIGLFEKRAREQLRLVNPGEIIFTFPDEDKE